MNDVSMATGQATFRWRLWGALAIGLALSAGPLQAQELPLPNSAATISLYVENDIVASTDEHYTSGIRLSYLSPDIEALPGWADWLRRWVPMLNRPGYTNNVGLAIGQNIYTPADTEREDLILNDRPYAGWLYGALAAHHKNHRELHKVELTLGVVGPSAMGEETQNGIHQYTDSSEAKGWDNQLHDELGYMVAYDYRRRYEALLGTGPFGADLIPMMGVSLGNILTEARVGMTLRAGFNVPRDFQTQRISLAGYTQATNPESYAGRDRAFSLYVFTGIAGRAIAQNIFLDGNTYGDSHSVDKEPFVGELEVGVGLRYTRWRFTYTQVYATELYEGQPDGQQYGSVALAYSF